MDSNDRDTKERVATDVTLEVFTSDSDEDRRVGSSTQYGSGHRTGPSVADANLNAQPPFRLYKQRYAGVLAIIALNIVAGMNMPWFGPIANSTSQAFGISLDEVNWLGNIVGCTYILVSPLVPLICSRFGLRISYFIGTGFLILSAWVRFAGTAHSLDPHGAYALLIIGQFLSAIPQVIFQVLAPKFSETWFDLKGRTTATMLMSISNPVGTAIGQLISPMIADTRTSVLVLGIISTAVAPFALLVGAKPPTPPSYSGSRPSHHFLTTLRAIFGLLPRSLLYDPGRCTPTHDSVFAQSNPALRLESPTSLTSTSTSTSTSKPESTVEDKLKIGALGLHPLTAVTRADGLGRKEGAEEAGEMDADAYMMLRERVDFVILTLVFSVLVAGVNTFSLLSNQILEPYGYSEDTAGLMGAALLLSGLVAAFATAPLFDRVLTHHLGLAVRVAVPLIAAAWLSLIWAARPNNAGALFAVFVVIGVCSISMLPVALELGCELTRNSNASSAILWCSANITSIVFVLVMSALRASSSAAPPLNMRRSLIFNGASICSGAIFVLLFRGHQRRREKDARVAAAAAQAHAGGPGAEESTPRNERKKGRIPLPSRIFRKRAEEEERAR